MKTRFFLGALALLFVLTAVGFADQAADEYDKLMKPAIAANMKLTMSMNGDLATVATNAADVKTTFAAIDQYWTMKGVSDAAMFAKNIEQDAADVQSAAGAGNADAAKAAQMKIGMNCGGCHMTHRVRNADNTFSIK